MKYYLSVILLLNHLAFKFKFNLLKWRVATL